MSNNTLLGIYFYNENNVQRQVPMLGTSHFSACISSCDRSILILVFNYSATIYCNEFLYDITPSRIRFYAKYTFNISRHSFMYEIILKNAPIRLYH